MGPSPSGTATVSPTAVPVGTGTVVPAQAVLSVTPPAVNFLLTDCVVGAQKTFTVANTGGQPLSWSTSAVGNGYSISPTSGTLGAGQATPVTVTVTVSGIGNPGTVTVSAPGAQGSPQTVTIKCGL
jgi:hypothetical protein